MMTTTTIHTTQHRMRAGLIIIIRFDYQQSSTGRIYTIYKERNIDIQSYIIYTVQIISSSLIYNIVERRRRPRVFPFIPPNNNNSPTYYSVVNINVSYHPRYIIASLSLQLYTHHNPTTTISYIFILFIFFKKNYIIPFIYNCCTH